MPAIWSMPERLEKSSAFQWPFSGASKHHSAIYVWKCILSFHFPISILKKLHKNVSCYATVPLKKAMPKIITILSFHFPISILKKIYKNVSTVPLKKSNAKIITNSCYIRLTLRGVLVINNNEYVHILFVVTDLPLLVFYPIVHFITSRTIKVINVTKVVRRLKIYT